MTGRSLDKAPQAELPTKGVDFSQSSATSPVGASFELAQAERKAPLTNKQVQEILNGALPDESPLRVDGAMGPATRARVREFQLRYQLEPTGQLDRATREKLDFFKEIQQQEVEQFKMTPAQAREFQRDLKLACYIAAEREKTAPHYLTPELEIGRERKIREGASLVQKARALQIDGDPGPQTQQLVREFGRYLLAPVPTGNPIHSEAMQQLVRSLAYEYRRVHGK